MQAWWFEMAAPREAAAIIAAPERIVGRMAAPSWQVNQDVNHLGAPFEIRGGCLAFVAHSRIQLAAALGAASQDARIGAARGEMLALRFGTYDAGGAKRPGRLPSGAFAVVARRGLFDPATQPPPVAIQGRLTVRRLGSLLGVLPG